MKKQMVNKLVGLKVVILPLSATAAILIAVLFIKPVVTDVNASKKTVEENKEQIGKLEAQELKMKELSGSLSSMEEKPMVMSAMPEQEEVERYMAEIYGRVSRSGVILRSFSTNSGVSGDASGCSQITSEASSSSSTSVSPSSPSPSMPTSSPTVSPSSPSPSMPTSSPTVSPSSPSPSMPTSSPGGSPAVLGVSSTGDDSSSAIPQTTSGEAGASQTSCTQTIGINFDVNGSWDQILKFLKYTEDTSRIADITKISIDPVSSQNNQGESSTLNVKVSLSIFSRPKSGSVDIAQIGDLAGGEGFSKTALKTIEDAIYGPFDYNYDTEKTSGKNIFK